VPPIALVTATVFCATFSGVLTTSVVHERQRDRTAVQPRLEWRAALGNALVEVAVLMSAVGVAAAAIAMR
jgi:hypothetical protein